MAAIIATLSSAARSEVNVLSTLSDNARALSTPCKQQLGLRASAIPQRRPAAARSQVALCVPSARVSAFGSLRSAPPARSRSLDQRRLDSAAAPMPSRLANASSTPRGDIAGAAAAVLAQVPAWPDRLHCCCGPVHAVSQHTPSTQKSVAQSDGVTHASPCGMRVLVGVALAVPVAVATRVPVTVTVAVALALALAVAVPVALAVAVALAVTVAVCVGVSVGVLVGVSTGQEYAVIGSGPQTF
jgi:hypothetical protein